MNVPVAPGTVTGIGSLPHADARAAVECVLELTPQLPAAPQLPGRSARESMLSQAAAGVPGLTIVDGRIVVDGIPELAAVADTFDTTFDGATWGGLLALLERLRGRPRPVKVQLTGPLTFGLALVEAGIVPSSAFAVAEAAVRARAAALEALVRNHVPDAPLVIFLDEPGLHAWGSGDAPLPADDATDLLSGALAALGPDVVSGVHCCGHGDWRIAIDSGPDILSVPAESGIAGDPSALSPFLERGGWVAWGVVPTDRPIGERADTLWRRLVDVWCELTRGGCDPVLLRRQALVTPDCGLAGHGESQVRVVFDLAREVGLRIEDQAVACRLSVGA